ncbi:MAG: T9SS type B sorting domain-containing protein, partial [Flavobacterium sp.]|nr:T9SS type B sorting domain-containing protein [Flavobacterium sp.]
NPKPVLPLSLPSYSLCETDPTDEREIFAIRDYVTAQLPAPGYQFAFYFSEADADNNQNPLSDNYQNVANPQTIWILVTNETTGCSNKTVLDLRVEPRPILQLPLGGLTLCDDNGEGYGNFDLTAEVNNLLNGATGVNVTFYETLQNAELAVDAITSNPYENITPYLQFIYIRAENAVTGCYSTYTLALNVNPSPIIPVDLPNLTLCDQDGNPQSGTTAFDLTQQNAIILAAQPAGLGSYTIRYFTTEANAQNNTAAIVPASNYINTTSPQTIWYRVSNNTSNCFSIGTFQLIVNTPLALTTPTPLAQCNPDNDNFMEFDLTTKDAEITQNLPGYTVTYYPSYAQALSETGPITNPTAYTNLTPAQTLGVVVTSPQGCKSFISLTIRVLPTPIVNTPPLLQVCDNTNPGDDEEAFDLTTHENIIRNNDPDITFAYFPTQADAIAGTNQIMAPTTYVSATGSVWVMAMNQQQPTPGTFCYTLVEQLLQVNPLPQVATFIPDYVICEPNTDNIATFTLNTLNNQVMESGDATGFTISYYETQADATAGTNALANSYTNTSNPQTIYIRVVNNQTGCVNATATVNLVVEEGAIANPIPVDTAGLTVCDEDGTNDGQTQFDLTPFGAIALGTQSPTDYAVSYYETQADALAGTNAIADPSNYTNTNNPQEIWIRVTNTTTVSQCASLSPIQLTVNLLPEITLNDGFICVNPVTLTPIGTYTIDTNIANPALYSYVWYFNGAVIAGATDSTYTTTQEGIYEVVATNIATGCTMLDPAMMTLTNTSAAIVTAEDVVVSGAFSQNQTITVNVTGGLGDYEYQLDNGPFQDSNVFTNVSAGTHTITVRDKNDGGCDTVIVIKTAINYPLFFTPNGDGHNDEWNIIGLQNQPNAKIYIFDRYGKLLKQISPTTSPNGWDGTFNGQPMPSTDYWFTVTFEENNETKEFKAHFSLKR